MKIFKDKGFNLKTSINVLILAMLTGGIFGFIYEEIFYYIDLGYLVKRGSSFGPWIPIYTYGALLIILVTYRYKDKPLLVFIINTILTGLLEYLVGYSLLKIQGIRLWDYNNEIWNYGNINGFVCLRSVLFFGLSSLLLIYVILPLIFKLVKKVPEKTLSIISYVLLGIYLIDVISYLILK